ncbi:hypothetical protein CBG46_10270 [Actinobacillus succinogenes]|uniref:Uncharacterized protein n=1 Tax=Actinobacillus succinogenes (strain ATCC 55618 / DSM 22257 / CCUG 43843 / 130Z) TaxID=339671 RepID=A6VNJ4_ACTSZ|nr:glucosyltransferase domain-containing protein [Actinobacillus succinogenes]ABR74541.1 conserved hypothetical protein [Actinobacillus succinogenes 130Z]PHI41038.1 hypothetical protein CBG46_10270 [Actinobacillus succinogenes]
MKSYLKLIYQDFISCLELYKKDNIKYFFFIFFIYLIGYAALLRADSLYIDDMRRVIDGIPGWENFSRFSSNFLSHFFHTGNLLVDISPLSQLISLIFLSLSSIIIVKLFTGKLTYFSLFSSIALGLSPYYLENMSYKFDSIYMSIAVFSTIFPFLFIKNTSLYLITGILSLLLMFTTYQSANSIFIIITICYAMNLYINEDKSKNIIKFILLSGVIFAISSLLYKLFIVNEINAYVSSSALPRSKLIEGVIKNFTIYHNDIYNNFRTTVIGKIGITLIVLFPFLLAAHTKKFKNLLIGSLTLLLAYTLSFGLYTILDKPLFAARAFTGIGSLFSIIIILLSTFKIKYIFPIYTILIFSFNYCLLTISNSYGNILKAQDSFNKDRAILLISNLNNILPSNKNHTIFIESGAIHSPELNLARKEFPILNKLVQIKLQKNWVWSASAIYKLNTKFNFSTKKCTQSNSTLLKVVDSIHHNIKIYDNDCIVVNYK